MDQTSLKCAMACPEIDLGIFFDSIHCLRPRSLPLAIVSSCADPAAHDGVIVTAAMACSSHPGLAHGDGRHQARQQPDDDVPQQRGQHSDRFLARRHAIPNMSHCKGDGTSRIQYEPVWSCAVYPAAGRTRGRRGRRT